MITLINLKILAGITSMVGVAGLINHISLLDNMLYYKKISVQKYSEDLKRIAFIGLGLFIVTFMILLP